MHPAGEFLAEFPASKTAVWASDPAHTAGKPGTVLPVSQDNSIGPALHFPQVAL